MVIRGATRGNGLQLASYLMREKGNDRIELLDVVGMDNAEAVDLSDALYDMDVTAELTKGENGLYHAQINPAPGEDQTMTRDRWFEAADILGEQLGLAEQRRIIVLHEKKGRTHAHVVWERYSHEKGILISDSFSRLAQDRARTQMEQSFGHKLTPKRNAHRPELKQALTDIWTKTESGNDFIRAAKAQGYVIAEGVPRHPFMVVDQNGRSFDLVRQLTGVRIKEVRARMKGETLIGEKEAIEQIRTAQTDSGDKSGSERERAKAEFKARLEEARTGFAQTKEDIFTPTQSRSDHAKDFSASKADMLQPDETADAGKRKNQAIQDFAANKPELTDAQKAREILRQQFLEQKHEIEERQRQTREQGRERGYERD